MANRVYNGVVVDMHYDDGRGHLTLDVRTRDGAVHNFWTNRRQQARQIDSWCAIGMTVEVTANPQTMYIEGIR